MQQASNTRIDCALFDGALTSHAATILPQVMTYLRWRAHAGRAHCNSRMAHARSLSQQKPKHTTTDIGHANDNLQMQMQIDHDKCICSNRRSANARNQKFGTRRVLSTGLARKNRALHPVFPTQISAQMRFRHAGAFESLDAADSAKSQI